ncbi:SufB/SufD family protein [Xiamenia xianingshaonis]|uniref:SufD family Fe-S cluster assembly protein n=1 Tax=Xiamenia xianingshaonis TaxID=2682776 RepID=A0ABX0IFA1_9ACTN|nr:SufD family Fe-S cluster assembly protein [Xiamenia xianingshaonis]NHM13479.1 SufD family Fe-S cluster assembly protein [Xiamenia xianingshaonis]
MDATVLHSVNAMPAPTWHRLAMNCATIDVPDGLALEHRADVRCDAALIGEAGAFDAALRGLQVRTFGTPEAACSLDAAKGLVDHATSPAGQDGFNPLDATALSAFQARAAAVEAARSVADAFETGMGPEALDFLREASGAAVVLATAPGDAPAQASVRAFALEGALNACALDVVVADGTELDLALTHESGKVSRGMIGSSLRAYVGRGATLRLSVTQAAGEGVTVLDDSGVVLDEGARLDVRHSVLGGDAAYGGLACDLRGAGSSASVTTRYIGQNSQERDFNFVMRHRGENTASSLNATGVLAGNSAKTLRGTIDFVRGCKGAEGSEVENVLMTSDDAVNRSVPVILCGEDDVAGNHGATIGSMNPEQMFYLESRGLSPQAAEAMALRAVVENACFDAPDSFARAAVTAFGRVHFPNFDESVA